MSNDVLDEEVLSRISKLIDNSSFGSDAAVEVSRRAPAEDVVAVCAAAEQHEASGPRFPCVPAETSDPGDDLEVADLEASPPTLDELVEAAAAGSPRALELLFAEVYSFVRRYCRGRLDGSQTVLGSADDVAQDVCLAVLAALPSYTTKGMSFRAFVYGVAAHKVTDALRASGRNRADPTSRAPDRAQPNANAPLQRVLDRESAVRLGELLHALPARQREVLVLRIAVGWSAEETAVAVGSTPGAVRVTQHRALNRLRTLVANIERREKTERQEEKKALGRVTQIERGKWWHDGLEHDYIEVG